MPQELKGIGYPADNATLWRYMSFEKFANILATESLFFTRADGYYEFGRPLEIEVKTLMGKDSQIIVSPHADEWVTKMVRLIVERCGFEFPVNGSKLLDPPS